MDDRHLDELLMSEVGTHDLKVARIIGRALDRLQEADPSKPVGWPGREGPDEVFDALLERVNALVDAGSLKAAGNTWWPRYSEVRLPNDDDHDRAAARLHEREVDVVLLSLANHRWQKVLKVVSQALDGLGRESEPKPPWWPADDESLGWV
jgi:hypothetical protein